MFTKKTVQPEEHMLQDLTDEQLGQVTGGGLAGCLVRDGIAAFGKATGRVAGLASSVSVSGIQVYAAGARVSTPALSTDGPIDSLL